MTNLSNIFNKAEKEILQEVNIEFGNGETLGITNTLKSNKTIDKTGDKDELQTKTADISKFNNDTKTAVANIVNYLKSKGLFEKVATKQSFNTVDVVMRADGGATINFDDGGSTAIPRNIVCATPQQQKQGFAAQLKSGLKAAFQASVEAEETVKENYFKY